jgi:hypothetical protein
VVAGGFALAFRAAWRRNCEGNLPINWIAGTWAEERPKDHRMERIRIADLDRIAQALDVAPVPERSEISKSQAIRTLMPAIQRMQARGHTAETTAAVLAANGVKITAPTLNNYLQRAKAVPAAARKRGRKQRIEQTSNRARPTQRASATRSTPPGRGIGTDMYNDKATFSVREDSDEI